MNDIEDKAKSIFLAAVERHGPDHWTAYVDEACAGDQALRCRVEALLQAHAGQDSLFDDSAPGLLATVDEPITERPGTAIGPYKLMEQIGEGGMGLVFVTEQQQPVRRKVALKVIKPGMDTRQVIARFEAERQALALMDHPNIAKVLDGGETASRRPYFVMELVKGVPITEYCDQNQVAVRERLELFLHVCDAVQHAHQKGIIHRDIKPSNVMVTSHDGKPVVRVIDFGVAKAIGQQLTDKTVYTQFAQLIGTPLYMSPEQAGESSLDIDTRSDIYSLGVLLYELLTGTTPFDRERLRTVGYDEMRRIIREEEPPKPSTRISTMGQAAATVSTMRKSDPKRLSQLFRGDLDWIVMKALEKDRNRRYETAGAFGADVQRYLADEPVAACPPSASYRLRKFVKRNRAALVTTLTVALALLVAVGGISWSVLDRAARQSAVDQEAIQALNDAEKWQEQRKWPEALSSAKRAEGLSAAGAGEAIRERVREMRRDVEMVLSLEDARFQGLEISAKAKPSTGEAMDAAYLKAFRDYGIDLETLPTERVVELIRARPIHPELTGALDDWASQTQSEKLLKTVLSVVRALDSDEWRNRVRDALWKGQRGREVLAELAASPRIRALPPGTVCPLANVLVQADLTDAAVALLRDAQLRHPDDHGINYQLAFALYSKKPPSLDEALRFYSAALALRPGHATTLYCIGTVLLLNDRQEQSIPYFEKAIDIDPDYGKAHCNLGIANQRLGRPDVAITSHRKAIEIDDKLALAHCRLGVILCDDKHDYDGAITEFQKAIDLDPKDSEARSNLGMALARKGHLDKAIASYHQAIKLDPKNADAHINLGDALMKQGKLDDAIACQRKAIEIDDKLALAHSRLGALLCDYKHDYDGAITEFRKAIAIDPKNSYAQQNLGVALMRKGNLEGAVASYHKAIKLDPKMASAYTNLGEALMRQGKLDDAIACHRKAIEIDDKLAPAHIQLGVLLCEHKHDYDGAITELQKAIALDSKDSYAQQNLGIALMDKGDLEGAVACWKKATELDPNLTLDYTRFGHVWFGRGNWAAAVFCFQKAVERDPKNAPAHYNLGEALRKQGKIDLAIVEYRKAVALDPDRAEFHCNLGGVLREKGEYREALQEVRRGHELGSRRADWPYPSAEWVREAEQLVELETQLPAFVEGKTKPAGSAEALQLAAMCVLKRLQGAAARFYAEAFAGTPTLANDLNAGHRYNAACAAALAGCGQGNDAGRLDARERARLRGQALAWLRADLTAWGGLLDKNPAKPQQTVEVLRHWLADPDFTGVRGPEALAKLPESERHEWQKLWDDVADMLKRAQETAPPDKK
jgi:tetratricopeptide (TPR) repeat protein/serine/threonine protein kinase